MSLRNCSSKRRRLSRYHTRRHHSAIGGISDSSGVIENGVDGFREARVFLALGVKLLPAGGREAVLAHLAPGFRRSQARLHPALDEQLLQGGIQRAFFDAELVLRQEGDALCHRVAVQRLSRKYAEDEEDQGPGRKAVGPRHSL